jgi:hypothetical protein
LTKGEGMWYTVVPLEESGITDGPMKYFRIKSQKNFKKGIDKGDSNVI